MLAALSISALVTAETLSREKITASYIYNFAKNIAWPDEQNLSEFNIALYRIDDPALEQALNTLAAKTQLKGVPITVSRATTVRSLSKYQLVYVGDVSSALLDDVYEVIEGLPILLVSSEHVSKQWVMVNLQTTEENRLRFEVNQSNILNQGLRPLPELILLGGTEIDVAKLYREGQASLVDMQKKLRARESELNRLTADIAQQEQKNRQLEQKLFLLNTQIASSAAQIDNQNVTIGLQRNEIEKSKAERQLLLLDITDQNQQLISQKQALAEHQEQLAAIGKEIEDREIQLTRLNQTIGDQRAAITELDVLVNAQKTSLRYLSALVVVGVLLIVTVFVAYTLKRRDNTILAARGQDLKMAGDRLAVAKSKAEAASQAKSEFLSLMTHELRTPLQAVIGYTDIVMEELRAEGSERYIDDLTRVINNSERLLKLINGVLDLARVESGEMELHLSEVKLSTLVDEAVDCVRPQVEKNGNALLVDVQEGRSLPFADPEKLLHILINLLSNATKFTEGGVIKVAVAHQAQEIRICVEDNGIGMSQDQQNNIFERFKQVDSSATRKFPGTGLGLAITRQFCVLMGGDIKVESALGEGAKFIVSIPLPIIGSS